MWFSLLCTYCKGTEAVASWHRRNTMAMDRKARLKGDEWARIWKYETERVHREGARARKQGCFSVQRLGQTCATLGQTCAAATLWLTYWRSPPFIALTPARC